MGHWAYPNLHHSCQQPAAESYSCRQWALKGEGDLTMLPESSIIQSVEMSVYLVMTLSYYARLYLSNLALSTYKDLSI
jgi:hypothetical protein